MCDKPDFPCVQSQRALRMLLRPSDPRWDRELFTKSMPRPTPGGLADIIPFIIDLILALLENKDPEGKAKPSPADDALEQIAEESYKAAKESIDSAFLPIDAPILAGSIRSICALISVSTFPSTRVAREQMRVANNAALGTDADRWLQWSNRMRSLLDNHAAAEALDTLTGYKAAWKAIAAGLDRF